jgi:hypothetical protein
MMIDDSFLPTRSQEKSYVDHMKRKNIPAAIKRSVHQRQKGKCACCLESGREYHHVLAASLIKGEYINSENIVLLCKEHHTLFHLGDPETFQQIYEYIWYLIYHKLPSENDLISIAEIVIKDIKRHLSENQES